MCKSKKWLFAILSVVVAIVLSVAIAVVFPKANSSSSQSPIILQKQTNYTLDGNYAMKELRGFNSEKNFKNNGVVLSSTEEGAQYLLADNCFDSFSMVALPLASGFYGINTSDATALKNTHADFTQMTIEIVGNNGQRLRVEFLGAQGVNKLANEIVTYAVYYNDMNTGITGEANFSYRTTFYGNVKPLQFFFDNEKNVMAFDNQGINSSDKIDLNQIDGLKLDNYSVRIKLAGLTNPGNNEKPAKIAIVELCEQALDGENVKPVIYQRITSNGVQNALYSIPKVYAFDIVEQKNISEKVEISVTQNGNEVSVEKGEFIASLADFYTITATIKDENTVIHSVSETIEVFSIKPTVNFLFEDTLQAEYTIYDTLVVPVVNVQSELFLEKVYADVFVCVNGETVATLANYYTPMEIKLEKHGEYEFIYSVMDYLGYVTNYVVTTNVKNLPNLQNVSLPTFFSYNNSYQLTSPIMIYNDVQYNVYTEVVSPKGRIVELDDDTFLVDELGVYEITYYTLVEGQQYTFTHEIESLYDSTSLIKNVTDITKIQPNCDLPSYSLAGNGIKVLGAVSGARFEFNGVINVSDYTVNDTIISMQPLDTEEAAPFKIITVTLTDINDPSNFIAVRLYKNMSANADQWSYITAKCAMSPYVGIEKNVIYKDKSWAGTVVNCSFNGSKHTERHEFGFTIDYQEREIYAFGKDGKRLLVADLDNPNHVGEGNIWNGFSEGKAYISVKMEGLSSTGGVIVTKVANHSLSGEKLQDKLAPTIKLSTDEMFNSLPDGALNRAYKLPKMSSWDFIDTNVIEEILLYKDNKKQKIKFDASLMSFVPTTTGKYYIEYKATDLFGNSTTRTLSFNILETIAEINVALTTSPETARFGEVYRIPEAEITGGSGIIRFEEKIYYGNEEIQLNKNRELILDKLEEIRITYVVEDYLGNIYDTSDDISSALIIEVVAPELPIVDVQNVPLTAFKGDTLYLPDYNVYDYSKTDFSAQKKVEVNGIDVTDTLEYVVNENKGEVLIVKYYAISDTTNVKIFNVVVLAPSYISDYIVVKNIDGSICTDEDVSNSVEIKLEKQYLEYVFSERKTIALPQSLPTDELIIKLGVDSAYGNFDYFDIYLEDVYNAYNSVFLRVCKDGYLEINGDTSKRLQIEGSFTDDSKYFYFIYKNTTRELYAEKGSLIAKIDSNVFGIKFNGFEQSLINLSVTVAECSDTNKASIKFMQIANQMFTTSYVGSDIQEFVDRTGPVIKFKTPMRNLTIVYGEQFIISQATAHDILKGSATISVSLRYVEGDEYIYKNLPCTQDYIYLPKKYGTYEITYVTKDKGNRETKKSVYIVVKEENAPTITEGATIKTEYTVGESIAYVKPNVTDESEYNYYMFVLKPNGKYIVVKEGESFTFEAPGEYKVVLYAEDIYFNIAKIVYTITVEA